MGVVYLARQLELERDVALKLIAPELTEDALARGRFLAEARAAAAVEHPNVVPVHAVGTDDDRAYLVMRFIRGDDLRTLVRRDGPLPPLRAAAVTERLAGALDAIHRAGYVHRDVKPPNVLIDDDGHVYLSDFGLAKAALATRGPTSEDRWVGTLDYVAPEQIRGGPVDARTDVYALGGVLHFMLTGSPPFERDGDEAKLWAHLHEPPPKPSTIPGVPAGFDAVVASALAKEPAARYPSAGGLGSAAVAAARGDDPDAPTISARKVRSRERRWIAPVVLAAAVSATLGAAVLIRAEPRPAAGPGDAQPSPSPSLRPSPPSPQPKPALRKVKRHGGMSNQPEQVAVAAGNVWVLASSRRRPVRLDLATGKRHYGPAIGPGASSIAADGDSIWVAIKSQFRVVRLDARTGRIEHEVSTDIGPTLVAAGSTGLWIATQEGPTAPAILRHYSRDGSIRYSDLPIESGIGDMVHGGGAMWLAVERTSSIRRFDRTGWEGMGNAPSAATKLAYGAGALWAVAGGDTISRINPKTEKLETEELPSRPGEIGVSGDLVVVALRARRHLLVLDARTMKRKGPLVRVNRNPHGIATHGRDVWVTGLTNTLMRLKR
jgi:serine/threonine protein kinase